MNHLEYLFAGFALAWAASFAYLWMLGRRAARLQQRLESIEARLEKL